MFMWNWKWPRGRSYSLRPNAFFNRMAARFRHLVVNVNVHENNRAHQRSWKKTLRITGVTILCKQGKVAMNCAYGYGNLVTRQRLADLRQGWRRDIQEPVNHTGMRPHRLS